MVPVFAKKTPAVFSAMLISFHPYPHIQCWGISKRGAAACEINAQFCKFFRALPSTLNEGDRGKHYMILWHSFLSGVFFANTGLNIFCWIHHYGSIFGQRIEKQKTIIVSYVVVLAAFGIKHYFLRAFFYRGYWVRLVLGPLEEGRGSHLPRSRKVHCCRFFLFGRLQVDWQLRETPQGMRAREVSSSAIPALNPTRADSTELSWNRDTLG